MRINLIKFWDKRRERFYRRHKWQLVLDFSLIAIILVLIGLFIQLVSYEPLLKNFIKWPINSSTPVKDDNNTVLSFDLKADTDNNIIKENENIIWSISFKNNGEKQIKEAKLDLVLNDNSHSIETIISNNSNIVIKDRQIIIKDIKVGEEISFDVNVGWKKDYPGAPRLIQTSLKILAISADNSQLEKKINLGDHKIIANISLDANLFYHSLQGDQLGIGPIPPQLAIPTKYWLIIKVDNLGNEIDNFIFSAELAEGVEFNEDDYSLMAGKFSYDNNRRLLIWRVDNLDAKNKDYVANFGLKLTPIESQVGKNAIILKNIKYHADDSWTSTTLSASLNNLDTSLPVDRINKGQGIVTAN